MKKTIYFYVNGVNIPDTYNWENLASTSPQQILNEDNMEVRRELLRIVGIEKVYSYFPHKSLDKQDDYELLSVALSDHCSDARYLKMKNPSIGVTHLEEVSPNCNTVKEAIAFRRFGDKTKGTWNPQILT